MKPCTIHDHAQSDESPKQDVYTRITGKIVAALEDGVRPWVRPWDADHAAGRITRPLRHNGQPYTGINILSLWASASVQGFAAPIWMTYRQAVELRAHVRKGEKGSPVVYANSITRNETDTDSGVDVARDIHFLKGYTVFNVEQIDGLPAQYTAPASPRLDVSARIARAECFFGATGATLAHGGNRAFYRPSTDSIVLPLFETFRDAESYYATLAHETTHWTAHESRLARDFGTKRFGSEGYAIEELVAELGAAFLCADLDLTLELREDHAVYIANWLDVLKADNRAIFAAASHAQASCGLHQQLAAGLRRLISDATSEPATPPLARSAHGLGGPNLGSSTHRDSSRVDIRPVGALVGGGDGLRSSTWPSDARFGRANHQSRQIDRLCIVFWRWAAFSSQYVRTIDLRHANRHQRRIAP